MRTKIILHAMFATAIALTSGCNRSEPAKEQSDWDALRAEVSSLRKCLAQDGAYAFVTNAATPKSAPLIHSRCWVDGLPKEEVKRRAYEQEKRDFGLDMVGQLETYALADSDWQNEKDNAARAHQLIEISRWLKTSAGYGNYLLYKWAENMAMALAGRLAVNSRADVKEIADILAKAEDYHSDVAFRITVLRDEAPHEYHIPKEESSSASHNDLLKQWGKNMQTAIRHYGEDRFWHLKSSDVRDDKREFAVYVEDPLAQWHTIRAYWDASQHRIFLICGLHESLCNDVRNVLSAREKIGPMPVPPATAFKDSAARHIYVRDMSEKCEPFSSAAHTAFSIFHGDFYDLYTWQLRTQLGKNIKLGR